MWTAADIRYDPVAHVSTDPDGRVVPHVTHILKSVGVTEDFETLGAISPRVAAAIEFALHRGNAVHADCHAYDDNDLDLGNVDPRILPWVEAWIECRNNLRLEPVERERRLYHRLYNYAGIKDGIFLQWRGTMPSKRILIDIKTGDPADAAGHLQTAAYEAAYYDMHGGWKPGAEFTIDERWAVQLMPGMKVPYRVINYTARPDAGQDMQRFYAAVTVYNEQPKQRRRAA